MRLRPSRGAALVSTVAVLAMLTALASGLAYTSLVDQRLARNTLDALAAEALARSGVTIAAAILTESAVQEIPDSLAAPWATPMGRQPLGNGWVEVRIEDEARRLDLNAPALRTPLRRLVARLGLDARLVEALEDWTDADDLPRPLGAERDYYLGLTPPYVPANAPLRAVAELRAVRGVDAHALARLHPFVTVADEAGVNPNTAPPEVLEALAPTSAAPLLAARAAGHLIDPAQDLERLLPSLAPAERRALQRQLVVRGRFYRVRAAAGVGDARRALEATVGVAPGLPAEIAGWRPAPESWCDPDAPC